MLLLKFLIFSLSCLIFLKKGLFLSKLLKAVCRTALSSVSFMFSPSNCLLMASFNLHSLERLKSKSRISSSIKFFEKSTKSPSFESEYFFDLLESFE